MKHTTSNTKGFTLIELLVVIAIIAILAAILFPVFAQAKQAAKKTADLSNMKQMATAGLIYSGDSDDVFVANGEGMRTLYGGNDLQPHSGQQNFPSGGSPPANFGAGANAPLGFMDPLAVQNWGRETMPYVKSMDMFVSPGAGNDVSADLRPVANNSRAGKTSYAFNGCVSNTSQTALARPAELITLQSRATTVREAITLPRAGYDTSGGGWKHASDGDIFWAGYTFGKGANYSFADGHSKHKMRNAVKWKDLGFFEWVRLIGDGRDWTGPVDLPNMKNVSQSPNYEGWRSYGACDGSREPWATNNG